MAVEASGSVGRDDCRQAVHWADGRQWTASIIQSRHLWLPSWLGGGGLERRQRLAGECGGIAEAETSAVDTVQAVQQHRVVAVSLMNGLDQSIQALPVIEKMVDAFGEKQR
ncbi:hypothetical protein ACLOJK_015209, partial [Asimina triloba]